MKSSKLQSTQMKLVHFEKASDKCHDGAKIINEHLVESSQINKISIIIDNGKLDKI